MATSEVNKTADGTKIFVNIEVSLLLHCVTMREFCVNFIASVYQVVTERQIFQINKLQLYLLKLLFLFSEFTTVIRCKHLYQSQVVEHYCQSSLVLKQH